MKKTTTVIIGAIVFLTLFAALPQTSQAQHYWLSMTEGDQISLEINKSDYDGSDSGIGFATSAWFLSGQRYFNHKIALVWEMPILHFSPEEDVPFVESQTAIGNPYVGIKINNRENEDHKFIGHFGMRLPFSPDNKGYALAFNAYGNYDRYEAFIRDMFVIQGAGTYLIHISETVDLDITAGLNYWIATEDNRDSELLLDTNFGFKANLENFTLAAGLTEKFLITADGDISDRTIDQIGFSGMYTGGNFKPGFIFKIPVDDNLGEIVDFVVGLKFIVSFE